MNKELKKKDLFSYGLPAIPLAFAGMPLYIHAPDYFATYLNANLGVLGIILLALRFIDAVQDPVIGRLSDNYSRYRIWTMRLAALLLVLSFTALFQPMQHSLLFWFAGFMLIATTSFSILSINLNTVGGLWCRDKHQKTQITSTREALSLIGLLMAVLMPSILKQFIPVHLAFLCVSIILAIIMIIAMMVFNHWQQQHAKVIQSVIPVVRLTIWQALNALTIRTKCFFSLYLMSLLASSIPAVLVLFFIRDRLEAENLTGLFLCAYFLAGIVGIPIWNKLSHKFNKYNTWAISMGLAVAVFLWAFFLSSGDIWQYGLICILSGIAFGADLSLPPSILADFIQSEKTEADASLQFGLLAFMAKLALALASVIAFSILDWNSFKPGESNERTALVALSFTYAALPCLIKLISMIFLFYNRKQGEPNEKNINSNNRSHHA